MATNNKGIKSLWGYPLIDSKGRHAIDDTRSNLENNYQKKNDDTLTTNDKSIVGSINEINTHCKEIKDNKADRNTIFTMANMGQDIKEAMTGGSVAVVGVNAVSEDNIINKQVTEEKIAFVELPINYNYFKNKSPYKPNTSFDKNGDTYENESTNIFKIRVEPNTEYKFSNNINNIANNVPVQKIVYSSSPNYTDKNDKISIVNTSFDTEFTTPEGC